MASTRAPCIDCGHPAAQHALNGSEKTTEGPRPVFHCWEITGYYEPEPCGCESNPKDRCHPCEDIGEGHSWTSDAKDLPWCDDAAIAKYDAVCTRCFTPRERV